MWIRHAILLLVGLGLAGCGNNTLSPNENNAHVLIATGGILVDIPKLGDGTTRTAPLPGNMRVSSVARIDGKIYALANNYPPEQQVCAEVIEVVLTAGTSVRHSVSPVCLYSDSLASSGGQLLALTDDSLAIIDPTTWNVVTVPVSGLLWRNGLCATASEAFCISESSGLLGVDVSTHATRTIHATIGRDSRILAELDGYCILVGPAGLHAISTSATNSLRMSDRVRRVVPGLSRQCMIVGKSHVFFVESAELPYGVTLVTPDGKTSGFIRGINAFNGIILE